MNPVAIIDQLLAEVDTPRQPGWIEETRQYARREILLEARRRIEADQRPKERRKHKRVGDWLDKLRDDRRIT